uniref:Uncharacterized protein n=1 Tax=Arundo donax TaxID=35708 RepID=A0A0A9ES35_ARUDO
MQQPNPSNCSKTVAAQFSIWQCLIFSFVPLSANCL